MGRSTVFRSSALALVLAFLPSGTRAQEKALREQLVGAWALISCGRTTPNGAQQPYCANPNGILILDASGRYAHMIASRDRPKLSTVNRSNLPPEQVVAAATGFVANFGTWSVNERDRTITRHYEGALLPNFEGSELTMTVSLVGDQLTLDPQNPASEAGQGKTVYRRLK
jgi:hypothetical protein